MRQAKKLLVPIFLLTLLLLTMAAAAGKRDPLTDAESDQLRDVAMEPGKRLKLYIKFAEVRLTSVEDVRSDPKAAPGRGKKIHDLLEDFTAILDEINDNLDVYQGRPLSKEDRKEYHKALQEVMDSGQKFDEKLKALKAATETNLQTQKEAEDFQFVLQDAIEALKSSTDMAKEYLSAKEDEADTKKK